VSIIDEFDVTDLMKQKTFEFAETLWNKKAQSPKDFGSVDGRDKNDFIADTVEGKIAEEIFAKFLFTNFQITMHPDYDIYPGMHEIDFGNDLQFFLWNGQRRMGICKLDIKSARHYAKWLLVEKHKSWADVYVLITIQGLNHDWERNPFNSIYSTWKGKIAGFAYYTDVIDQSTKKPWFIFKQGEQLFDPVCLHDILYNFNGEINADELNLLIQQERHAGRIRGLKVRLKSPVNHGIPKIWLRNREKDWKKLVQAVFISSINHDDSIMGNIVSQMK
jgi:hypothetical protein